MLDVQRLRLVADTVIDSLGSCSVRDAVKLLGRVGLSEAWCLLTRPGDLSEGERLRFRFAVCVDRAQQAIERGTRVTVVCDEFCAVLDRVTACASARGFSRAIRSVGAGLLVATSHHDLLEALQPDRIVSCDFDRVEIQAAGVSGTSR